MVRGGVAEACASNEEAGASTNEKARAACQSEKGQTPKLGARCASEQTATDCRITLTRWWRWPRVCPLLGVKRTSLRRASKRDWSDPGTLEACKVRGYATSVVVVDRGGNTVVALRGDNAGVARANLLPKRQYFNSAAYLSAVSDNGCSPRPACAGGDEAGGRNRPWPRESNALNGMLNQVEGLRGDDCRAFHMRMAIECIGQW